MNDRSKPTLPSSVRSYDHDSDTNQRKLPTSCRVNSSHRENYSGLQRPLVDGLVCVVCTVQCRTDKAVVEQAELLALVTAAATLVTVVWLPWWCCSGLRQQFSVVGHVIAATTPTVGRHYSNNRRQHHASQQTENRTLATKKIVQSVGYVIV